MNIIENIKFIEQFKNKVMIVSHGGKAGIALISEDAPLEARKEIFKRLRLKVKEPKLKNMDYKLKLMQILECVASQEGTIFDNYWNDFGITEKEKEQINKDYAEYENEYQ